MGNHQQRSEVLLISIKIKWEIWLYIVVFNNPKQTMDDGDASQNTKCNY